MVKPLSKTETATDNIVVLEGACKNYQMGEVLIKALRDVDLEVKRGEFLVVLGPSGSGKTTLLNLLGGIDTPTSGRIIIEGVDISRFSQRRLTLFRREKIGFIFQFLTSSQP